MLATAPPQKCRVFVIALTRDPSRLDPMDDLWSEIDDVVLQCLAAGVAAPAEIGQRLGMSEAAAGSILAMLAAEGKVTICRARLS